LTQKDDDNPNEYEHETRFQKHACIGRWWMIHLVLREWIIFRERIHLVEFRNGIYSRFPTCILLREFWRTSVSSTHTRKRCPTCPEGIQWQNRLQFPRNSREARIHPNRI